MARVRYVGNAGRYRLTNGSVNAEAGEAITVDEDTASYLLENAAFERVEETEEITEDSDGPDDSAEIADPPIDPGEYTIGELEDVVGEEDFSDAELRAIQTAEANGRNRTGARGAIDARLED